MTIIHSTPEQEAQLGLKFKHDLSTDAGAPLAIFVHGRAGDLNVMWTFRRVLNDQFSIIAPQAPLSDPIGGFSWWHVEQSQPKEEIKLDIYQASAKLESFISAALSYYRLSPRKIIAFGFSQGGAVLTPLIFRPNQTFDGLALLASFIVRPDLDPDQRYSKPKIFIAHGTEDETISIERARKDKEYLARYFSDVQYHEDKVGHKVGASAMRELKNWVENLS